MCDTGQKKVKFASFAPNIINASPHLASRKGCQGKEIILHVLVRECFLILIKSTILNLHTCRTVQHYNKDHGYFTPFQTGVYHGTKIQFICDV